MQHVLDIDLDFFLADCCELAKKGERPPLAGCEPWRDGEVRRFLEDNCGLDRAKPIPGRVFETHDSALVFWQELVTEGRLSAPFSVTHVDAHSDLGIGYPGPGFVLNTVISTRIDLRTDTQRYYKMNELDEANYLLFAIAYRYVAELINVRNPKSREDIPREISEWGVSQTMPTGLHLSSFASNLMARVNGTGSEPSVKYSEYRDPWEYRAENRFDFVSLAMSPRYAPKEADALAEIIREYMIER